MIKVSYVGRRPSQHRYLSNKKRRLRSVIHVTVRSSQNVRSIAHKSSTYPKHSSILPLEDAVKNSSITENSVDKSSYTNGSAVRQNIWEPEDMYIDSTDRGRWISNHQQSNQKRNQTDATQDHHRKRKKINKHRRLALCIALLAIALICTAIAITLGILLSKKPATKITLSSTPVLRWNSSGITILGKGGISGANSSLLHWPYGMAFDSSNTLHIADYQNHRIQKLLTDTFTSVTVAGHTNGTSGSAMNELYLPVGILFDSNDNMYITDRGNNRVQLWAKGATSAVKVAGANGRLNISLAGPSGIVSDSGSDIIFIADTFNHRVISYPAGAVVAGGNGSGNAATQLYHPYGLVYESISKRFVIPNYDTNNIVRWALGATNRTHVAGAATGIGGSNSTLLRNPVGMTMDPMGNIYVADSSNHRIQLFMVGETDATTITGTGVVGINANQLNTPFWVILDNQLNLYVSDTFNNRVQKFLRY